MVIVPSPGGSFCSSHLELQRWGRWMQRCVQICLQPGRCPERDGTARFWPNSATCVSSATLEVTPRTLLQRLRPGSVPAPPRSAQGGAGRAAGGTRLSASARALRLAVPAALRRSARAPELGRGEAGFRRRASARARLGRTAPAARGAAGWSAPLEARARLCAARAGGASAAGRGRPGFGARGGAAAPGCAGCRGWWRSGGAGPSAATTSFSLGPSSCSWGCCGEGRAVPRLRAPGGFLHGAAVRRRDCVSGSSALRACWARRAAAVRFSRIAERHGSVSAQLGAAGPCRSPAHVRCPLPAGGSASWRCTPCTRGGSAAREEHCCTATCWCCWPCWPPSSARCLPSCTSACKVRGSGWPGALRVSAVGIGARSVILELPRVEMLRFRFKNARKSLLSIFSWRSIPLPKQSEICTWSLE